jgi:hypothetical protein
MSDERILGRPRQGPGPADADPEVPAASESIRHPSLGGTHHEEPTMIAVRDERIVAGWSRDAFGMPAFRVHAADYPEAEA